ncbi:hypothetical protein M4951_06910 [Blastopirellula sp. J2-11]|uniref:hypothetical protein n=1 Tax=Blastopirellula sp. J2-11 TaxID=2943192 RepID=UPI0021C83C28|nr:hypothetical protein [Blastopirellula sp. J2-11]UUO08039.1 hypothetical protein M4951_06910 [Blastopirellula sp. J2-11]
MPINGTNSATGKVKNGRYELSTFRKGDGAPPGEYNVSISSWKVKPTMEARGISAIPERYFNPDKSGLTVTITDEGARAMDFALDGK